MAAGVVDPAEVAGEERLVQRGQFVGAEVFPAPKVCRRDRRRTMARNSPLGSAHWSVVPPLQKKAPRASRAISMWESMGISFRASHRLVEIAGVLPGIILGQIVDGRAKVAASERSAALAAATGEDHGNAFILNACPKAVVPRREWPWTAIHLASIDWSLRRKSTTRLTPQAQGALGPPFMRGGFGLARFQRQANDALVVSVVAVGLNIAIGKGRIGPAAAQDVVGRTAADGQNDGNRAGSIGRNIQGEIYAWPVCFVADAADDLLHDRLPPLAFGSVEVTSHLTCGAFAGTWPIYSVRKSSRISGRRFLNQVSASRTSSPL